MGVTFLNGASRETIYDLYSDSVSKLAEVKSETASRLNLLKGQRKTASIDSDEDLIQTATAPVDDADKPQAEEDNCTNCG